jgi:hypothetical protein
MLELRNEWLKSYENLEAIKSGEYACRTVDHIRSSAVRTVREEPAAETAGVIMQ